MPQEAKIPLKKIPGIQATFTAAVKKNKKNDYHLSEELFRPVRTNTTLEFRKLTLLQQLHKDVLLLVSFPGRLLFSSGVQLFCTEQSRQVIHSNSFGKRRCSIYGRRIDTNLSGLC